MGCCCSSNTAAAIADFRLWISCSADLSPGCLFTAHRYSSPGVTSLEITNLTVKNGKELRAATLNLGQKQDTTCWGWLCLNIKVLGVISSHCSFFRNRFQLLSFLEMDISVKDWVWHRSKKNKLKCINVSCVIRSYCRIIEQSTSTQSPRCTTDPTLHSLWLMTEGFTFHSE